MRKRRAVKRDVLADPIYNSKVVTKLINAIMKDGKKGLAQKIFYGAMDIVKEKTGDEPLTDNALSEENFSIPSSDDTLSEHTSIYSIAIRSQSLTAIPDIG